MAEFFYRFISGRSRFKPQILIIGVLVVTAFFAFLLLSAVRESARQKRRPSNPFAVQPSLPKRDLDYKIIKLDSIAYNPVPARASGAGEPTEKNASQQHEERTAAGQPTRLPARGSDVRAQTSGPSDARSPARQPSTAFSVGSQSVPSTSSNMIVVDQRGGAQTGIVGGAAGSITGLQTVRLKVILLERTPVTNGSLVEARVMADARYGNLLIPRRSQLLGIARLQNNRVEIDFREIQIQGKTYTCTGRAYDLKNLPGIAYNPLSANARQALLDELKSAASGVPLLGRIVNQPNFNPVTDEITALDEGLEFYALITNIF